MAELDFDFDKLEVLSHFADDFKQYYAKYLDKIQGKGSQLKALCPFHDDKNPSFSFNEQTGQYFCHGCGEKGDIFHFYGKINNLNTGSDFGKILNGIAEDFSIPTTSANKISKPKQKLKPFEHFELGMPVKKYAYTDVKGKVLYYNCRFKPKDFRQCSANGLKWSVKDIDSRVPYQLPKVKKAKTAFILNGEKACEAMNRVNQVGTCNVAGEGNWTSDLNPYFKGKEVILTPDNDSEGRKHAKKVYHEIKDFAANIKLLELPGLPEKGDFADWLDTFDDMDLAAEQLAIMTENAGPYEPKNDEDLPRYKFVHNKELIANLKPIRWQIQDVMPEGSFYYDFGESGSYKTFVAIDRLLCVAAGIRYHGHKTKQGTVFYIAGEGQQLIGRRVAAWHIYNKTNANDIPFFLGETPTQLMDPGAVDDLRKAVDYMSTQYGSPAIVHIDTLARNFGDGDENSTKDMNRVISNLDKAFGNDFCRGLTHHTGHFHKDRARGAYALHASADGEFKVTLPAFEHVLVECTKMKDAVNSPAMLFELDSINLLIDNQNDKSFVLNLAAEGLEACKITDNRMEKVNAVITALTEMKGFVESQTYLKNAIMLELDCKEYTARKAIERALEMGKIIKIPGSGKGTPHGYKLLE